MAVFTSKTQTKGFFISTQSGFRDSGSAETGAGGTVGRAAMNTA